MYKCDIIIIEETYLYKVDSYNSNSSQEEINDC